MINWNSILRTANALRCSKAACVAGGVAIGLMAKIGLTQAEKKRLEKADEITEAGFDTDKYQVAAVAKWSDGKREDLILVPKEK